MTTLGQAVARRKIVLKAIVDEYVNSCAPVASGTIVTRHHLGVSSATVRKDMASLEEDGLIFQPHLSAGRVPLDAGYRYFVQELLPVKQLTRAEAEYLESGFMSTVPDEEVLLEIAQKVLVSFLGNVAFVILSLDHPVRLEAVTIVPREGNVARMIVAVTGAPVVDRYVSGFSPDEAAMLERYAREMTDTLAGLQAAQIEALPPPDAGVKFHVRVVLIDSMREAERARSGSLHYVGLSRMIEQPEFKDVDLLKRAVGLLESGELAAKLVPYVEHSDGVRVFIGGEALESMRDCTAVVAKWGAEAERGIIGVLGPSRMVYRRAIGAVRNVAEAVGERVDALAG